MSSSDINSQSPAKPISFGADLSGAAASDTGGQSGNGQLPGTHYTAKESPRHQGGSLQSQTVVDSGASSLLFNSGVADIRTEEAEQTAARPRAIDNAEDTNQVSLKGRTRLRSVVRDAGYGATLGAVVGGAIGTLGGPLGMVVGVAAGAVVFGLIGMGCSYAASCWRDSQSTWSARFVERLQEQELNKIDQMKFNDADLTAVDQEMIREALREAVRHDLSTHREYLMRSHPNKGFRLKRFLTHVYLEHFVTKSLRQMKSLDAGQFSEQEKYDLLHEYEQEACVAGTSLFKRLLDPKWAGMSMTSTLNQLLRFVCRARDCTRLRWRMSGHLEQEIPQEKYDRDRNQLVSKAWSETPKRLKPAAHQRIFKTLLEDANLRLIWEYAATVPVPETARRDARRTSMPAREFASLVRQIALSIPTGEAFGAQSLCCTRSGPCYGRTLADVVQSLEKEWATQHEETDSRNGRDPVSDPTDQGSPNEVKSGHLPQRHRDDIASRTRLDKAAADMVNYLSFVQGLEAIYQLYQESHLTHDPHAQRLNQSSMPLNYEMDDISRLNRSRQTGVSVPERRLQKTRHEWEQFLIERAERKRRNAEMLGPDLSTLDALLEQIDIDSSDSADESAVTRKRGHTT